MAVTSSAKWLVVENNPWRYNPMEASLLCVVEVGDSEVGRFTEALEKHSLLAYKETYGQYFHREGWTKRKPVTVRKFIETVQSFSSYDTYGIRDAFKSLS